MFAGKRGSAPQRIRSQEELEKMGQKRTTKKSMTRALRKEKKTIGANILRLLSRRESETRSGNKKGRNASSWLVIRSMK